MQTTNNFEYHRYKLSMQIKDETREMNITIFRRTAELMVKKPYTTLVMAQP